MQNVVGVIEHHLEVVISKYDSFLQKACDCLERLIAERYYTFMMKYYRFFRFITYPFNLVIPQLWKRVFYHIPGVNLLRSPGVHYVEAPPGGGKSSIVFQTIEQLRIRTGRSSMVNTRFEKPRADELGEKYHYHKFFDFDSVFHGGKQLYRFDPSRYIAQVYEELHMIFNPRENRQSVYNDKFKPWHKSVVMMRHDGFEYVYLISQLQNDIQLMSICKYKHEVQVELDVSYKHWLQTGEFKIMVDRWIIDTKKRTKGTSDPSSWKTFRRWTLKADYEIMLNFETHAYREGRNRIPLYT